VAARGKKGRTDDMSTQRKPTKPTSDSSSLTASAPVSASEKPTIRQVRPERIQWLKRYNESLKPPEVPW
jgi:hypothetical protein